MDDVTVNQGAASTVIDLAPVFDDLDIPRGDQFTYTVAVSPPIRPIVEEVIESSYMDIHQDLLYTHLGDNRGYDSVQHDLRATTSTITSRPSRSARAAEATTAPSRHCRSTFSLSLTLVGASKCGLRDSGRNS